MRKAGGEREAVHERERKSLCCVCDEVCQRKNGRKIEANRERKGKKREADKERQMNQNRLTLKRIRKRDEDKQRAVERGKGVRRWIWTTYGQGWKREANSWLCCSASPSE